MSERRERRKKERERMKERERKKERKKERKRERKKERDKRGKREKNTKRKMSVSLITTSIKKERAEKLSQCATSSVQKSSRERGRG